MREPSNRAGLPEPLVEVAKAQRRPPWENEKTISATELVGPPRIRQLRRKHWEEIEWDVADSLFALRGTAMHSLLEGIELHHRWIREQRVVREIAGWGVNGKFDLLELDSESRRPLVLWDYKDTSLYTLANGVKPEWEAQLNIYRWLIESPYGSMPPSAFICAQFRDWSKPESLRKAAEGYPQEGCQVFRVDCWSTLKIEAYIRARLLEHESVMPLCTAEERWNKGDKWAVIPRGKARAMNGGIFENPAEAHMLALKNPGSTVEHRPGVSMRCCGYCDVVEFCDFGRAEKARFQESHGNHGR